MQSLRASKIANSIIEAPIKHPILFIGVFSVVALLCVLTPINANAISVATLCILTIFAFGFYTNDCLDFRALTFLLFFVGLALRLQYILYTGCTERQHDVEVFGCGFGHSGYIEYLYNEFKLPDFDVREVWQFYHPPLHHLISAVFLKLCNLFCINYNLSLECLQVLTFFYSALCMLITYRILEELRVKGKALIFAFSIVVFHPTFIIFAGSINNDILSITFQLGAILYTIRWIKEKSVLNIIAIALCIGLGMMTKLSAWMVAPAVAAVFLISLIKDVKEKRRSLSFYLKQYSVFAVICIPLGLWWSVRNYLLHSVPPNYIPFLEYDNPQYIGDVPVINRLFDFGAHQFKSVFDMWGKPYFEYNPTIGLLKTAMFGESINDTAYPIITGFGTILFWIGAILAVLGFFSMCCYFISRKCKKNLTDMLMVSVYVVNFVMYYYFCITFPFTCTQNIRYATPLILIGIVYIGKIFAHQKEICKWYRKFVSLFSVLFGFFSFATYTLIGL